MPISAWFQKLMNQSKFTMLCCLCQLPPAELSEGEGAVWAAQLLEWSQLYLQEPGENTKRVLLIICPDDFNHAVTVQTYILFSLTLLPCFSDWAIYQDGYSSKPARYSVEVSSHYWQSEWNQWLQLPGKVQWEVHRKEKLVSSLYCIILLWTEYLRLLAGLNKTFGNFILHSWKLWWKFVIYFLKFWYQ